MIDLGCDVNGKNQNEEDGSTPLHNAVNIDNLAIFELLLDNGADESILNGEGESVTDQCEEFKEFRRALQKKRL